MGVWQGDNLSPLLFSLYINDMDEFLKLEVPGNTIGDIRINTLLYADDAVILAGNELDLQRSLDCLQRYCETWKLTLNTDKTKVIVFRKGGRLRNGMHFTYDDIELEIVGKFNYLGLTLSSSGVFSVAQQTLAGQARKSLFRFEHMTRQFYNLKPRLHLELFDKLITPVLSYCAEVWGFHKAMAVKKIHTQFWRKVLGVKSSTSNDITRAELGRKCEM